MKVKTPSSRRTFLSKIAAGAATLGIMNIPSSVKAAPKVFEETSGEDAWFKTLKGKHRIVFDVPEPNGLSPFAWPRVFLMTNVATGTPEKMNNAVVVLRHAAIPYAFDDAMWQKYNFGEVFKIDDPITQKASVRNPFRKPTPGEYKIPGFGAVSIGINELQASGVMFCVCNAAMTVYSAVIAEKMQLDAAAVKNDWTANLLPGVKIVPSGVWALGRAQENGCAYCFAG
ncbi:hypothetical protein BH09BAC2_BH09BAC2_04310 [soil metagenome]